MESLVILVTPNKDSFDVIIGKLDVENLQEAEHTDHFELTILARHKNIKGEYVRSWIVTLTDPYLRRIEQKITDQILS